MEKKDNLIGIDEHTAYKYVEGSDVSLKQSDKVTNPIAKNFSKFFQSPKGKLSIKDILK